VKKQQKIPFKFTHMTKITLVLGASLNEGRYSNRAIKSLKNKNKAVVAVGLKKGTVADVTIDTAQLPYENIDTVTLYLNPKRQEEYYIYILSLKPRRVIFNPGTENTVFEKLLLENKIESEVACTLVLLATNQY
jgi:predicted CoA-binding protein|tara:strand:+ start:1081 stop:1482 length:402 start_codon:yes stop_codon:yes gene_type:complete